MATKRNMAAETPKAIKAGAALTGVQDAAVANFTLASLLDVVKAALGKLATIDLPGGTQRRFLDSSGQWFYIDFSALGSGTGGGGSGPVEFSLINGSPTDNTALALALSGKASNDALASLIAAASVTSSDGRTYSVNTIRALIAASAAQVKNDLVAGAGGAYDTLLELQQLLVSGASESAALVTALGFRIRYDAVQSLTESQKAQAISNLGLGSRLIPANPNNKPFLGWFNGAPVWVDAPAGTGTGTTPSDDSAAQEAIDVAAVTALSASTSATQTLTQRLRTSNGL